jgi:hypothetical protein
MMYKTQSYCVSGIHQCSGILNLFHFLYLKFCSLDKAKKPRNSECTVSIREINNTTNSAGNCKCIGEWCLLGCYAVWLL